MVSKYQPYFGQTKKEDSLSTIRFQLKSNNVETLYKTGFTESSDFLNLDSNQKTSNWEI